METSYKFKARCIVNAFGKIDGLKYARSIKNSSYQEAADYIEKHEEWEIKSHGGNE